LGKENRYKAKLYMIEETTKGTNIKDRFTFPDRCNIIECFIYNNVYSISN